MSTSSPLSGKPGNMDPRDQDAQRALALAQQGNVKEVEVIYRRLINEGVSNSILFRNLGTICGMQGRPQEMIRFLNQALAMNPRDPEALTNLGIGLRSLGKLDAAIASWRQALEINPDHSGALSNLGLIFQDHGKLDAAIVCYLKALNTNPDSLELLNNLANALQQQENLDAAIACYRKALAIKPDFPEVLSNLGSALSKQGDLEAAVASYQKSLDLKSDSPDTLANLGSVLQKKGDLEAAIMLYEKALAIKPDCSRTLSRLAGVLKEQGNLEAAIASHRRAISYNNYQNNYQYACARLDLSFILFLHDNYKDAWNEYEWRHEAKYGTPPLAHPPVPQWNGQSLSSGETLMLVSEGGLGDTLQFMRYIPYLNKLGIDVTFCSYKKLQTLIRSSGIITRLCTPEEAKCFTAGLWLPLLSLPRHLKVTPVNPLVQMPYLKVSAEKVHHWQEKLAAEKRPVIGLHWQGNTQSERRNSEHQRLLPPLWRSRSLPLEAFAPISETTSVTFLSLQKGAGSEELDHCSFRHRFVACQDDINGIWDFVETAAMVANCDLIITNDTALAHLAGGLGQPVWLLLNNGPDWRWGAQGESTFWYPSMRLFRQREWDNWPEVMERVLTALEVFPGQEERF